MSDMLHCEPEEAEYRAMELARVIEDPGLLQARLEEGDSWFVQVGDGDWDHMPGIVMRQRENLRDALEEMGTNKLAFEGFEFNIRVHPCCMLAADADHCVCSQSFDVWCKNTCLEDGPDRSEGFALAAAHLLCKSSVDDVYAGCMRVRLDKAFGISTDVPGANETVEEKRRRFRFLLPVVAEMLIMQCVYFVMGDTSGSACIRSSTQLRSVGSCYRVTHMIPVCYAAKKGAEDEVERRHCTLSALVRARDNGVGAQIKWSVNRMEGLASNCRCKECTALLPVKLRKRQEQLLAADKERKESEEQEEGGKATRQTRRRQ